MKILMVLQKPFPPDIRVTEEAASLVAAGHQVHLLCRREQGQVAEEEVDGIRVHRVHVRRIWGMGYQSFHFVALFVESAFLRRIFDLHARHHFGAIHVHDLPLARTSIVAGRRLSVPVVFDMHESWPELVRLVKTPGSGHLLTRTARMLKNLAVYNSARYLSLERWCLERADHVIVVADEQRRRLLENGLVSDRISVVMNAADIDRIRSSESYSSGKTKGIDSDCMIVFLGIFLPHRGLDVAIRALALVRREIPNAHLLLVGEGDIHSDLARLAEEMGLRDAVTFTGWVDLAEALALVRASDIGLIPHRRSGHIDTTLPHKLFQYMALGKPVVVADAPPLKRIVEGAGCGIVFRSGDPQSLAAAIVQVASSGRADEMGARGRQAVYERYCWEREQRELVALYDEVGRWHPGRRKTQASRESKSLTREVGLESDADRRSQPRGRVLILTYFFPPLGGGGTPRMGKYVKFLPRMGWQPIVLTADERVYRSVGRPIDESLMEDVPAEAIVMRTNFWDLGAISRTLRGVRAKERADFGSGWKRTAGTLKEIARRLVRGIGDIVVHPDAQLLWLPVVVTRGLRLIKRHEIDVILTYSNPYTLHFAGAILKLVTGVPWVADYADPWTVGHYNTFEGRLRIRLSIQRRIERFLVRKATRVSLATEVMESDYRRVFGNSSYGEGIEESGQRDKFITIRNGFDPDDFESIEPSRGNRFTITYTGSVFRFYPLHYFLEALRRWLENDSVAKERTRVNFVGNIDVATRDKIEELGLGAVVRTSEYVSRPESHRYSSLTTFRAPNHFSQGRSSSTWEPASLYSVWSLGTAWLESS
jgi:glycosyltransferase involved in cell wall biosynthesis